MYRTKRLPKTPNPTQWEELGYLGNTLKTSTPRLTVMSNNDESAEVPDLVKWFEGLGKVVAPELIKKSPKRWDDLAKKLEARRNKLKDLLAELEAFWNGIENMDAALKEFEHEIQNQHPVSVLEDTIIQQTNDNIDLEKRLRQKTAQLTNLEDLSGALRVNINREDAIQVKNAALTVHSKWDKLLQKVIFDQVLQCYLSPHVNKC